MAFASDSTAAPARPLLPFPALDRRAIGRDGWARARELVSQLGGEIRDHVAEGMRQAWAAARELLQADSPAQSRSVDVRDDHDAHYGAFLYARLGDMSEVDAINGAPERGRDMGRQHDAHIKSVDHPDHVGAVPPLLPIPAPLPSLSAALSRRRGIFGAVVPDTLDAIRADLDAMLGRVDAFAAAPDASIEPEAVEALAREGRHLYTRRALERAADHAAAMLPALGLPRLVSPDFASVDPVAAGDALEAAIAALDALDADSDLEPSLGYYTPGYPCDAEHEPEHDEDDGTGEPSLASPERHPRVPTITWGKAYTARGGEEGQLRWAEGARHDGELDPCDGPIDDDELDDDGLSTAEGDHAEDEPTLGAPAGDGDQERWAQGFVMSNDPEADETDAEPEEGVAALWVFGPSRREATHA